MFEIIESTGKPIKSLVRGVLVENRVRPCGCGCGTNINLTDSYGRPKTFISGHNGRRYSGTDATRAAATKRWAKNNPEKIKDSKKHYYRQRKLMAMKFLGNKCNFCGIAYSGSNSPIFEFHHTNPKEKDAGITRIVANWTWDTVVVELKKCVLTCANCHNQHHGGSW